MRRAPLLILFFWASLCGGCESWIVVPFMAAPIYDDAPAHSWAFQFAAFVAYRLWFWVATLLIPLAIEGFWRFRQTRFMSMHVLWIAMLIAGFLWLCLSACAFPLAIDIAARNALPSQVYQQNFTREETGALVHAAARATSDLRPWIFTPALLMLFGGILLSRHHPARDISG